MLALWYDPDPRLVLTDLLSGSPIRPTTAEENLWLFRLSERIRASAELRSLFFEHGVDYLTAFESCSDGAMFIAEYRRFMAAHAHRGHSDRDMYYPRRCEGPTLDYETFKTLLTAENPVNPVDREHEVTRRREAVQADVEAKLGRGPFGALPVRIFRGLLNYAHRFFLYRDNQRQSTALLRPLYVLAQARCDGDRPSTCRTRATRQRR